MRFQLLFDGCAQYAFALAVNEYNFLSAPFGIFAHHTVKFLNLILQHIGIAHAMRIVE